MKNALVYDDPEIEYRPEASPIACDGQPDSVSRTSGIWRGADNLGTQRKMGLAKNSQAAPKQERGRNAGKRSRALRRRAGVVIS